MIKRKLAALAIGFLSAAACFGQTAPGLGGTWKLTRVDGQKVVAAVKPSFSDMILKIALNSAEVKMERTTYAGSAQPKTAIFTFYSDKRGESNDVAPMSFSRRPTAPVSNVVAEPSAFLSKTFWDNEKLITEYSAATTMTRAGAEFSTGRYEWKLSEDGRKLIVTSSGVTENNNSFNGQDRVVGDIQLRSIKYVFERLD